MIGQNTRGVHFIHDFFSQCILPITKYVVDMAMPTKSTTRIEKTNV